MQGRDLPGALPGRKGKPRGGRTGGREEPVSVANEQVPRCIPLLYACTGEYLACTEAVSPWPHDATDPRGTRTRWVSFLEPSSIRAPNSVCRPGSRRFVAHVAGAAADGPRHSFGGLSVHTSLRS